MKFLLFFIIIGWSTFSSYAQNNAPNYFYIKGNIKGINSTKVYLVEAHYPEIFLDSAKYANNKFLFKIPITKPYAHMAADIVYIDSINHKIQMLLFINHILTPKRGYNSYGAFIVEGADVEMEGVANIREYRNSDNSTTRDDSIHIKAGQETDALYATQLIDFGNLDEQPENRIRQLNLYILVINKFPDSKYLLSLIDTNKSKMSKSELKLLLQHFSQTALQSSVGKRLLQYAGQQ
jgi:hypothetical protein